MIIKIFPNDYIYTYIYLFIIMELVIYYMIDISI